MAEVIVIGAGLSGTLMAYELLPQLRKDDRLTVVSQGPVYHFVPSNPWVAIGWRKRSDIEIDLVDVMKRKGIRLLTQGAQRVHPADNRIELADGTSINYDYLVVATGPELAFDEIPGLGPEGHTQSICHIDQELRRRKLRDRVPMTFVTSEPYIGHLGLDGVGNTKGLLESEMREKHIKWITNARVKNVEQGKMSVEEIADDGSIRKTHELPFAYSMMLPAFRGVGAVRGIEKLTNPRGFVIVDKYQRNPEYSNIFAIGVCVAIAPVGATPVPVGVPKTGFMIESMVTATARNIGSLLRGQTPVAQPTWNAICLADFGDSGVAFLAQPQIPPRNVNWSSKGEWVHFAKVAFEKYFLRKIRRGESEPFYERFLLDKLNIAKVKEVRTGT
jgi:sulfide:quinone oxidoreductase